MKRVLAEARLILANDLRLLWRDMRTGKLKLFSRFALIGVLMLFAHAITLLIFSHLPEAPPLSAEAVAWAFFGFTMLGVAMSTTIRMFFERADFDLLLASPVRPASILLARIAGMTATTFLSVALFVLPVLNGIAFGFSARYFAGYAVWLLLAAGLSSIGTFGTLLLVRGLGPQRARTVVQVAAGLTGALVYLLFQLQAFLPEESRIAYLKFLGSLLEMPGAAVVARAGRGSLLDLLLLLAATAGLVALTTRQLARTFLTGLQDAGARASARRRSAHSYRFGRGLRTVTFWKDLRLIVRDPLLLTNLLPSLLYIVPAFFAFRKYGSGTMLAPIAVVVAAQFSSLLTEVAAAGEECLDLIRMSPSPELRLRLAKMSAGMALPLIFTVMICVAVAAMSTVLIGAVTFLVAVANAAACAWLHVVRIEPTPRKDILRRRKKRSSIGRDIAVGALILTACAGVSVFAHGTLWFVGLGILGANGLGVIAAFVLAELQEAEIEQSSPTWHYPPAS